MSKSRAGVDRRGFLKGAACAAALVEVVQRGEPALVDVVTQPR